MSNAERVQRELTDAPGRYVLLGAQILLDRRLRETDVRLHGLIALIAGRRTACVVARETLANLLDCSPSKIDHSKVRLEEYGYLRATRAGVDGLRWTLLPPTEKLMAEALASQLSASDDSGADRRQLPPATGADQSRGPGPALGISATTDQHTKTTSDVTLPGPQPRQAGRARTIQDPKILGRALADVMNGALAQTLRGTLGGSDPVRPVLWNQVEPWLQAGVSARDIFGNWEVWLEQVRREVIDPDRPQGGGPPLSRYLSQSGYAWCGFAEWVLTGGAFRRGDHRFRLPATWYEAQRQAAEDVRQNTIRRARRAEQARATNRGASLWWSGKRASMGAIGAAEISLAEGDGNARQRDIAYPTHDPVWAVLERLIAEEGPLHEQRCLSVINSMDEALDLGYAQVDPAAWPAPCGLKNHSHAIKHRRREENEACPQCGERLVLICDEDFRPDPYARDRGILHDGTLICTDCEFKALLAEERAHRAAEH